jgi:hypothetical protein
MESSVKDRGLDKFSREPNEDRGEDYADAKYSFEHENPRVRDNNPRSRVSVGDRRLTGKLPGGTSRLGLWRLRHNTAIS